MYDSQTWHALLILKYRYTQGISKLGFWQRESSLGIHLISLVINTQSKNLAYNVKLILLL